MSQYNSFVDDAKYPIGKFQAPPQIDAAQRQAWVSNIKQLPAEITAAVAGLPKTKLDIPYRNGGWSVRQVIHHVADSHLNSYVRFRWALTEESPLIKTYNQTGWAGLPDAANAPVEVSVNLLTALHARWVLLLEAMTESDFARTLKHPELGEIKLDWMLGLYAWHGRHHTAHIQSVMLQKNQ